jgi:hypothetical protein
MPYSLVQGIFNICQDYTREKCGFYQNNVYCSILSYKDFICVTLQKN